MPDKASPEIEEAYASIVARIDAAKAYDEQKNDEQRQRVLASPGVISIETLQGKPIPSRRWCIPDWIPDRQVTSIYGDGGTGKSLLAMQLATACALGSPWLGMDVNSRKVLYVSCEDDCDEMMRRQDLINRNQSVHFRDFEGRLVWLDRSNSENPEMMSFEPGKRGVVTGFGREVEVMAEAVGAQLIIIDTLADVFGGNEIDRSHVRQFIGFLRRLARKIDGAVVFLAHPSAAGMKDRGYSGSTAWRGSVRSMLTFEFPEADTDEPSNPDLRVLTRRKSNYAASGTVLELRYAAGTFLASSKAGPEPLLDQLSEDGIFIRALRKCLDAGECPTTARNRGQEYAPKLVKRICRRDTENISVQRLEAAMNRLLDSGEIIRQRHWKSGTPLTPKDYDVSTWRQPKK
ncbi:AAA family ATPase [Breoghania sp. L-A4]|uniref:AAA family ATPase n=1 Tax=Breoghania sp. L-A4 TaxID=2304600 RepID=UPI000E35CA89|nr:AAA family ATPase [Breoghania sp. L-A4]AXS39238.1 ATPase [Breoghania sp. L-A4]